MTLQDLSEKIGVSEYSIMRYENGQAEPAVKTVEDISRVLNIDVDHLCDVYYRFLLYPFNTLVKEIRKELRLTQPQFGKRLGVGRKTVERWEAGTNRVSREMSKKMKHLRGH